MEGLNQNAQNGVIRPDIMPDSGPSDLNITVSHGPNQHQVVLPSNSTFGDLKLVVAQKVGLKPEMHKLLFRGKEKEDDDHLQTAGVKDNSKVLLMEDTKPLQNSPKKVETPVISRGGAAVAEVRAEVDKLTDQVAALQAVVDGETKTDYKKIIYLSEMLMRQLLKLDSIEAEGEVKVQRKMEVRRVQSIVETLDFLKSKNANLSNNKDTAAVTTHWETFEPGSEGVSTMSVEPSSTATLPCHKATPIPTPSTTPYPAATLPSHNPTPTPVPSTTPNPTHAAVPLPATSSTSTTNPFSVPGSTPVPFSSPSHLASSTKVTQDWEQFD